MIQFILSNLELAFLFLILAFSFFIYWCIDEKSGLQICIVTLLCVWLVFIYQMQLKENNFNLNIRIGWVIIAIIYAGFIFLRKTIESLFLKGGFRACMIAIAAGSFIMILYRPEYYFVMPAGILLGMGIGYCLNKKYIGFKSRDYLDSKGYKKILILLARFFTGVIVLAVIVYRVILIIQHVTESQNIFLYMFLCCALVSLWISIAAPWLFIKLRFAGSDLDK